LGEKRYELSNHLGNVLAVITDRRFATEDAGATGNVKYYEPNVVAAQDYDPFGMLLSGRSWEVGSGYRYGFNSQEQDDEVYGDGNLNTAEFWEYDTRLGKRWNLDPVDNCTISRYATFYNNPVINIDIDGDCPNGDCKDKQLVAASKIVDQHFNGDHNLTDISSLLEQSILELDKEVIYGPGGKANLFEFNVGANGDISVLYPELETFKDLVYDIWVDRFVLDFFNNTSFETKIESSSTDVSKADLIAERHFASEKLVSLWNITHVNLFDLNFGISSISMMMLPVPQYRNSRATIRMPYSDSY
jgi:hypothetical protein